MLYDLLGALASMVATYYYINLSAKAWIISLFAIAVNGWIYWQTGIYADMCLEIFYCLTTCYGWYQWRHPMPHKNPKIPSPVALKQWPYIILIMVIYAIIYLILVTFTQSDVAHLDALTTSLSLIAQWLMGRKNSATWILWFVTDGIYAFLYLQKELPFHVLLMLLYTAMAAIGYWVWRNQYLTFLKSTKNPHLMVEPHISQ